ncbi:hypothetical protein BDZ94DRAFT_1192832 [Collybia nuda]|uniref:DUF6593 domain-containing protein n=1 Tax=Collybia nuda TaxID=64659 RepID=A0A9P5Y718_9AGAR|nr:hypothetical protein BDZ94DRAFT_1192832 [Collybia nuda]
MSFPFVTFTFNYNSSILNSVVVGPQARKFFQVMTDPADPRFTIFQDVETNAAAYIEWQAHPVVEIRGIIASQRVSQWLALAANQTSRTMAVKGRYYSWVPGGDSICMYSSGSPAEMFAKITRGDNTVKLEMTPQAIQAGLLEACVVSAFLLQCGRVID